MAEARFRWSSQTNCSPRRTRSGTSTAAKQNLRVCRLRNSRTMASTPSEMWRKYTVVRRYHTPAGLTFLHSVDKDDIFLPLPGGHLQGPEVDFAHSLRTGALRGKVAPAASPPNRRKQTMKKLRRIGAAALVLALAIPAFAGHNGEKCHYSTQECLDHMAAKMKSSGWVGVELDMDSSTAMPTVTKVVPGSPAEAAGILPGDLFVALNGVKFGKDSEQAIEKAETDWN